MDQQHAHRHRETEEYEKMSVKIEVLKKLIKEQQKQIILLKQILLFDNQYKKLLEEIVKDLDFWNYEFLLDKYQKKLWSQKK